MDALLTQTLPGQSVTVSRLCGGDPYAEALAFALWTNNPRHAEEYLGDAAQTVRRQTGVADPALWGPDTFRTALLARCRASHFSNWKERAALIALRESALHSSAPAALTPYEQLCQAALSARKIHLVQLASRHKPAPPRSPARAPLLSRRRPAKHGILTVS